MTTIRKATIEDLDAITALEAICFPEAEAASRESFEWRLRTYPEHFIVMEKYFPSTCSGQAAQHRNGEIISFINGPVTKEKDLVDEMYDSPDYSDDEGDWQMIFGLVTHPDYQRQGNASRLMRTFIDEARNQGRKGVVLTCKEHKIAFYSSFGYKDEGVSSSTHGGVPWHQMRITF